MAELNEPIGQVLNMSYFVEVVVVEITENNFPCISCLNSPSLVPDGRQFFHHENHQLITNISNHQFDYVNLITD